VTTTEIIWIAVIAVAALVVIGLIVGLMRKRSQERKHAQAEELRHEALTDAAVLPDSQARAEQAQAEAEAKRIEAERAQKDAALARTEVDQQQALQEDRIRAADRLDPHVDHKAQDYSPEVATPAGPANVPGGTTETRTTGATTDMRATDTATTDTATTDGTSTVAPGGTSVDLPAATREPTDTTPRDTTTGVDGDTLRDRLDADSTEPDTRPGSTDGAHRA
jgi:hypothetical protein